MDIKTLVDEQKDAGEQLLTRLRSKGFDVTVGLWAFITDEDEWRLYIASSDVERVGLAQAFVTVNRELVNSTGQWVQNSDVRLIESRDPIAVDAVRNGSDRFPTNFGGRKLGGSIIDGAYIYPLSGASIRDESQRQLSQ
jgi:hypothetical protein